MKQLKILLVDDTDYLRRSLEDYLQQSFAGVQAEHIIIEAVDGEDGLEKFRAEQPNLVITDLSMPKMSGEQMAARIKQLSSATPIIMLTTAPFESAQAVLTLRKGYGEDLHKLTDFIATLANQ